MDKTIFVEHQLCTGCEECVMVCSLKHSSRVGSSQSAIRVIKLEDEGFFFPILCYHCDPAPCMLVCPSEAMGRDPNFGAVVCNKDMCLQCGMCTLACPFGAVKLTDVGIVKCDLCGGDPTCVQFCKPRPEETAAVLANPRASCLQWVPKEDAAATRQVMLAGKVARAW